MQKRTFYLFCFLKLVTSAPLFIHLSYMKCLVHRKFSECSKIFQVEKTNTELYNDVNKMKRKYYFWRCSLHSTLLNQSKFWHKFEFFMYWIYRRKTDELFGIVAKIHGSGSVSSSEPLLFPALKLFCFDIKLTTSFDYHFFLSM